MSAFGGKADIPNEHPQAEPVVASFSSAAALTRTAL
jgi:hypothetical protein